MEKDTCCDNQNKRKARGIFNGLAIGLAPHIFCILFMVFTIVGSVGASALMKKFLLIPYFFFVLFVVSLLFATISAIFHLRKTRSFCCSGLKNRWKYVVMLFATTIMTNIVIVFAVFPAAANWNDGMAVESGEQFKIFSLQVDIPCSGHAQLIIEEVKKDPGVSLVKFKMPSTFDIIYNLTKTSPEKIKAMKIFEIFKLEKL